MGIGLVVQLVIWVVYALVLGVFVRYVARHAIALYCTRAKETDHRARVFVQNLEEESLDGGPYTLRIELHPHAPITHSIVRAGSKVFLENKNKLQRGIWEVHFQELPPLDTWLFEVNAPTDKCKVVVTLAPSSDADEQAIRHTLQQHKLRPWPVNPGRSMQRLATSSLALDYKQDMAVEGSYITPHWSAVVIVGAFAVAAYLLVMWTTTPTPDSCSPGGGLLSCIAGYFRSSDILTLIGLTLATLLSTIAGRRQPFPIAQGYLEKSHIIPVEHDGIPPDVSPAPHESPEAAIARLASRIENPIIEPK
jgi:hypothetical protein